MTKHHERLLALLMALSERSRTLDEARAIASATGVDLDALLAEDIYVKRIADDIIVRAAGRELVKHARIQMERPRMGEVAGQSRRTIVTHHAVDRGLQRFGYGYDWAGARREIGRQVIEGMRAGRIANHKPSWWPLLHGEKSRGLPKGHFFVWNESRTRAWIVDRRDAREDVVITSLYRVAQGDIDDA